ncbi:hypothetical protein AOQ84DRAFT_374998 [Glonium stellatum]|uniref:Rhodopsin domain-containing protein n=1 Tax=Glonium stellatum TaxID=574774 RepID=A0A8E2F4E8_9PEZI|nr:hypothetical protein AOQ84DRAFT_374998 [Glonium stellatum]
MLASSAKAILATNAIFISLSGASVALRFYARTRTPHGRGMDDWLNIAAWVCAVALAITNIVGVPVGGFGSPFESLNTNTAIEYLKIFFVLQFWYISAVALVKLSVLFFYKRIFTVDYTPTPIWVLIALSIGWFISFFFATLFQILPIWCNWIACQPTANYPAMYLACSVTDIVIDISILCLPGFFIRHLQMSLSRKIGIVGIFGLGTFCIVSSVARLAYTVYYYKAYIINDYASNFDISVDNIIMWSGIEACASTICANLPCYGPLIFSSRHTPISSSDRSGPSGDKTPRAMFVDSQLNEQAAA